MEKNKGLWIIAVYFLLSIYLLPMFPHGGSPVELTRWATTASIVEKGTFDISWTEPLIGSELEAVRVGDKLYATQAPGAALVAVPAYAIARLFVGPSDASNMRITWFASRFFVSTLPLLLLAFWLFSHDSDEISLAALLLASPLFVYSLLFYSHVFVAVLLYFAFRLVYDADRIFLRNCLLAGALCGFAVVCEPAAVVPVTVFGLGLLFAGRRNRNLAQTLIVFFLGGAPFAMLLAAFNLTLFGSPLGFPATHEVTPALAGVYANGPSGYGIPRLSNLYTLLLSPSRGLFAVAPLMLMTVFAFLGSRERRTLRHRVKVAAVVATVVLVAGNDAAAGGWSFGPRHLALVMPLLLDAFFDGEIYEYSNVWQGILFTISFVLCTIPALTFPFAPPEFTFPHNDFWGRLISREQWITPTMADVFGFRAGIWHAVPAVLLLVAAFFVVRRSARRPSRFTIGMLVGILLTGGYIWLPRLESESKAFGRASVAERYFRPAGRLDVFRSSENRAIAGAVSDAEWGAADARAYGPDDFPYAPETRRMRSPSSEIRLALELARRGSLPEAEEVLRAGRGDFPFARCEFVSNLAVLLHAAGRVDEARSELESIQNLVQPGGRPDCVRSQYLLGTIYRESRREDLARESFRKFLENTKDSPDAEIQEFRREITR